MGLVGRAWLESTSDQKFFIEIRTSESLQHYTTSCDGYELFGLYRGLSSLALPSFNLQWLGQWLLHLFLVASSSDNAHQPALGFV